MKIFRKVALFLILILMLQISFSNVRPPAKSFPTKSIIIGTYIIDYKAIDAKSLDLAEKTIESSGQKKIYYKSDLTTQKVWIDISSGEAIGDIKDTSKNIVADSVIDALPLTHWIKDDGSVIIFATGQSTSINNIHELLNPKSNEAMAKLIIDLDLAVELYKADDDDNASRMTINILTPVLSPIGASTINPYDSLLQKWDAFIAYLKLNDASSYELALASLEKDLVFTKREIAVENVILARLHLATEAAVKNGLSSLNSDIWEAIGVIEASISEMEDKISVDRSSLLAIYRANQQQMLGQAIVNQDFKMAKGAIEKIAHVDHIVGNLITNKANEVEILNIVLVQSFNKIKGIASEGNGSAYYDALKRNEAISVLNNLLAAQSSKLKDSISELNTILEYLKLRTDTPSKQQAIIANAAENLKEAITLAEKANEAKAKELANASGTGSGGDVGTVPGAAATGTDVGTGTGTGTGIGSGSDSSALDSLLGAGSPVDSLSSTLSNLEKQAANLKALGDATVIEQLEYLETLDKQSEKLYTAYLEALENNNPALAEKILSNINGLLALKEALHDSYGAMYGDANEKLQVILEKIDGAGTGADKAGSGENKTDYGESMTDSGAAKTDSVDILALEKARIDLLNELEKFKLLLSPTDLQLLELYQNALQSTKDAISLNDLGEIVSELQSIFDILEIMPPYLYSQLELRDLNNKLIEGAKSSYILGDNAFGDGLLALAGEIKNILNAMANNAFGVSIATNELGEKYVIANSILSGISSGADSSTGDGSASEEAAGNLTISKEGKYILVEIKTIKIQGTTYVPIKAFYELFNLKVLWYPAVSEVEVKGLLYNEIFKKDSLVVRRNESSVLLNEKMRIVNGVSYIPISYLSLNVENYLMPNYKNLTLIIIPIQ